MKKQVIVLLTGMMMVSVLLGGCGSKEQQASEQAVSGAESRQESSQQAETQESRAEEEGKAALDEPYVLVREIYTKDGTAIEYGYDENGDKILRTVSNPDKPNETLYREYSTQYQEDGSKIVSESQTMVQATGEPISSDTFEYEYNSDGLLIRKTGFSNGEYQDEICYEYDEKENLISQSEGEPGTGVITLAKKYEYDDAGNLIKETPYDLYGEVNEYWTYEYDKDGKQILQHHFNASGEEMESYELCQWKYEYDGEGRVIEEWKEGTEHGGKYEHYEYEYDEYGNVCRKKDLGTHTTYEYAPLSACVS